MNDSKDFTIDSERQGLTRAVRIAKCDTHRIPSVSRNPFAYVRFLFNAERLERTGNSGPVQFGFALRPFEDFAPNARTFVQTKVQAEPFQLEKQFASRKSGGLVDEGLRRQRNLCRTGFHFCNKLWPSIPPAFRLFSGGIRAATNFPARITKGQHRANTMIFIRLGWIHRAGRC